MNDREYGELFALAFQLLVQRVPLDDAERVSIAEFHRAWQPKAYGASEYVRYGLTGKGRAQLWMSTRSVAATAPPPDVPTNPVNWKRL